MPQKDCFERRWTPHEKQIRTHLSRRPYLAFARAQEGSAGIVQSAVCAAEQDVGEPDDIRSPHQSGARAGQRKGLQRTEYLDQLHWGFPSGSL